MGIVFLVGNSHIDVAWLWPKEETKEVCMRTFLNAVRLINEFGITYAQSNAIFYYWIEQKHRGLLEEIGRLIAEEKWIVVGGSWVEVDANMPLGESLMRQFLYGIRYLEKKFGVRAKIAWFPDTFGFPISLPKILRAFDIEYFLTSKLHWNDTTRFPYNIFIWRGDDGSEVLSYLTVAPYDADLDPAEIDGALTKLKKKHGIGVLLYLFGRGDHGGGPSRREVENFVAGKHRWEYVFSDPLEFFQTIRRYMEKNNVVFPEVSGELYLEFHRGVYTVQPRIKRLIRDLETGLLVVEFILALLGILDRTPRIPIRDLWLKTLTNQFHDIMAGSLSIDATTETMMELISTRVKMDRIRRRLFDSISSVLSTENGEPSILVLNSLPWQRDVIVTVDGELMKIENIPGFGYRVLPISRATREGSTRVKMSSKWIIIENDFYRVYIGRKSGLIHQIFDKRLKKTMLSGPIRIRIYRDMPVLKRKNFAGAYASIFDAWEVFIYDCGEKYFDLHKAEKISVAGGSLKTIVISRYRARGRGMLDSTFTMKYIFDDLGNIDIEIEANWRAKHYMAKLVIPLSINTDHATYGAPYGKIVRLDPTSPRATKKDRAKYEVPSTGWVYISDGRKHIGIATYSRFGFSKRNNIVEVSLLRAPSYPSKQGINALSLLPRWAVSREFLSTRIGNILSKLSSLIVNIIQRKIMDQGKHRFMIRIRLCSSVLDAIKSWLDLIFPPQASKIKSRSQNNSVLEIEPDEVVCYIKPSEEDPNQCVVRLWNPWDTTVHLRVSSRLARIMKAYICNGLEEPLKEIEVKNNTISIEVEGNAIKTLKLLLESS